jgi:hypothetical protein
MIKKYICFAVLDFPFQVFVTMDVRSIVTGGIFM